MFYSSDSTILSDISTWNLFHNNNDEWIGYQFFCFVLVVTCKKPDLPREAINAEVGLELSCSYVEFVLHIVLDSFL